MRVNGIMTFSMATGDRRTLMETDTREIFMKERATDKANTILRMGLSMKDSGSMGEWRGEVHVSGLMGADIKGNGMRTKSTEGAFTNGRMVESMKANTLMIRSTAREYTPGQMGEPTRVDGKTTKGMGKASTRGALGRRLEEGCGRRTSECDGQRI